MVKLNLHPRTKPNAVAFAKELTSKFSNIRDIYGWRQDSLPEHPSGRALDVMLPLLAKNKWNTELGNQIAEYVWDNRSRIKLQHMIWNGRILSVPRAREGWRPMRLTGNLTADHRDHIHIWLKDEKFEPLSAPKKTEPAKVPGSSFSSLPPGKYEVIVDALNVRSAIGGHILKTLRKGQRADVNRTEVLIRSGKKEIWGHTVVNSWVCIKQNNNSFMKKV